MCGILHHFTCASCAVCPHHYWCGGYGFLPEGLNALRHSPWPHTWHWHGPGTEEGQWNVHQGREGEWAEVCRLSLFKVISGFQLIRSFSLLRESGYNKTAIIEESETESLSMAVSLCRRTHSHPSVSLIECSGSKERMYLRVHCLNETGRDSHSLHFFHVRHWSVCLLLGLND